MSRCLLLSLPHALDKRDSTKPKWSITIDITQTMRTRKEEDEEEEQEIKRHTVSLSFHLFPPSTHMYSYSSISQKKGIDCCVLGTPQGTKDLFLQWCVGKPSFLGSCGSGSPPGNKTPVPRGQSEECHDLKLRSRQLFDCRQQILMRR